MALGLPQPLTEMSTRNISWGKGGRCVGLTTLPPSCALCLASASWNTQDLSRPVMRLLFLTASSPLKFKLGNVPHSATLLTC
jgi:hypothetical protein